MLLRELTQALQHTNQQPNKFSGIVTGYVEDVCDPAGFGRIKVNIPEIFTTGGGEDVMVSDAKTEKRANSYYARLATLMAGGGRGSYFIPEVGDEVIVAFEHDDMSRPVILGVVWNSVDRPPEEMDADGKNNIRALHTRSGHKLVFNDSEDEPSILIVDKTGENRIFIDSKANKMAIKVKGDLSIEVGGAIKITAGKNITLESQADVEMKAQGKGTFESQGAMNLKSSAQLGLEGTAQTELKGKTVAVSGDMTTTIKGGTVMIN